MVFSFVCWMGDDFFVWELWVLNVECGLFVDGFVCRCVFEVGMKLFVVIQCRDLLQLRIYWAICILVLLKVIYVFGSKLKVFWG